MIEYYIVAAVAILSTGVGQVLLKIGASGNRSFLKAYFNPWTVTAYVLFLAITVLSIFSLGAIDLKLFYVLTSISYIVVIVLSTIILKEQITNIKMIGTIFIVIGIIVFNI